MEMQAGSSENPTEICTLVMMQADYCHKGFMCGRDADSNLSWYLCPLLSSDRTGHSWQPGDMELAESVRIEIQEVLGKNSSPVHRGDLDVSGEVSQARP